MENEEEPEIELSHERKSELNPDFVDDEN